MKPTEFHVRLDLLGRIYLSSTSDRERVRLTEDHRRLCHGEITYDELIEKGYGDPCSAGFQYWRQLQNGKTKKRP